MPTMASTHIDVALTDYVIREGQFPLTAEQVAPIHPSPNRSDLYYKFGNEMLSYADVKPRSARAVSGEGRWSVSTDSFYCLEYPYKTPVEQDLIDNSDPTVDPMANASLFVTSVVKLAKEKRLYTALTTAGNFSTVNGAGALWSAGTSIEADIDTAREGVATKCGFEPNTIVIGPGLAKIMKRQASLRDLIRYTDPSLLVNGDLPPTLFNLKVVIPGARANTAHDGQALSIARLFPATAGASAAVLYVDPNAGGQRPTWMQTFRWSKYGVGGQGIRTWWVDDGRYWNVEYGVYEVEKLVSANCGALITGVL